MARWKPKPTKPQDGNWRDLRDAKGKLCARLDTKRMVLETRRNGETTLFDLAELFPIMQFYVDRAQRLDG